MRDLLEKRSGLLLCLILLLALGLRLPGLATWWFNPDEGIIFSVSSWARFSDFLADLQTEPHPPLYYALTRATLALGDSIFVLRLPSFIAWLFSIHALYLLTKRLFDEECALLAAILLVFASYSWTSAVLLRSYSVWLCFQLYALTYLVQWLQTHRKRALDISCLFWCLSLLTHYFALTFLPVTLLLLWLDQHRRSYPKQELRTLLYATAPFLICALLLFQFHFRAALLDNAGQQAAQQVALAEAYDSSLGISTLALFRILVPPFGIFAACYLCLLGLFRSRNQPQRIALILIGLTLLQAIILSSLSLYPLSGSRHNFVLAVLLLPAIAAALVSLLRRPHWLALPFLALILLGASWNWVPDLNQGRAELPGKVLDHRIRRKTILDSYLLPKIREGGLLLLDHQSFFSLLPLFYKRRPDRNMVRGPAWHITPYGQGKVIVSGRFALRGEPTRMHSDDHLLGFMETVDRDAPELHLFDRQRLYLAHAGWRGSVYEILRASRDLPVDPGFLLDQETKDLFSVQVLQPKRYQTFMLAVERLLQQQAPAKKQH